MQHFNGTTTDDLIVETERKSGPCIMKVQWRERSASVVVWDFSKRWPLRWSMTCTKDEARRALHDFETNPYMTYEEAIA